MAADKQTSDKLLLAGLRHCNCQLVSDQVPIFTIEGTNDDPSGHGALVEIAAKALRDSHLDFFIKYPLEGLKKSGIYRPDFLIYDRHGRFVLWVFHEIEDGIQTQQANVNDETWLSYNGFMDGQSVLIMRYPAHQLPQLAIEETVQLIAKSFSVAHA